MNDKMSKKWKKEDERKIDTETRKYKNPEQKPCYFFQIPKKLKINPMRLEMWNYGSRGKRGRDEARK